MLIEDDPECAAVISRTFGEVGSLGNLGVSTDCQSALSQLRKSGRNHPQLILLDLDMPQMSAFRFLEAIKADPTLRTIPVVVLSAHDNADDIATCYSLGVAGYLVKSDLSLDFVEKIRGVCGYWTLSRVPMA